MTTPLAPDVKPTLALFGRGIYSIAEAARLIRLTSSRVNRWAHGYSYVHKGQSRSAPPLVGAPDAPREGSLSFLDLLEILYLEHFLRQGISVQRLRRFVSAAQRELDTRHPFATNRFRTDGRDILLDRDRDLVNLITEQIESPKLLRQMLRGDLDFNDDLVAQRWWPLSRQHDVVIDPRRRFGAPVSHSTGIPTEALALAYRAEKTYKAVAWWYEIDVRAVKDAVRFERGLQAA